MYALRESYPNNKSISENFMRDFHEQLDMNNIQTPHFGFQMIITDQMLKPLITVVLKYMLDILGLDIVEPTISSFDSTIDPKIQFHLMMHKCSGTDLRGMYVQSQTTIYVKNNIHLIKLLPTLFHELTHTYMHQKFINMDDDYPEPSSVTFNFADLLYKADQDEGFCELVMTIMCYSIFDLEEYPSNVDSYWLGWKLNITAFVHFSNLIKKQNQIISDTDRSKLALLSMINIIRMKNNLYIFVKYVPSDSYHRKLM